MTKTVTKQVAPDVTAQIYWLKNRLPGIWRDHPEEEEKSDTGLMEALLEAVRGGNGNG